MSSKVSADSGMTDKKSKTPTPSDLSMMYAGQTIKGFPETAEKIDDYTSFLKHASAEKITKKKIVYNRHGSLPKLN